MLSLKILLIFALNGLSNLLGINSAILWESLFTILLFSPSSDSTYKSVIFCVDFFINESILG